MAMKVVVSDAHKPGENVRCAHLSPAEVRQLGNAKSEEGEMSVIRLARCDLESNKTTIYFSPTDVSVLNVGTGNETLFIIGNTDGKPARENASQQKGKDQGRPQHGHSSHRRGDGDKVFLSELNKLPEHVQATGQELLSSVRQIFPGDLKPYPNRRFFETPDNFWGVEIQTRNQVLKITVRGDSKRFADLEPKVWLDRPPSYFAFKISSPDEVPGAMQIIRAADRKERRRYTLDDF